VNREGWVDRVQEQWSDGSFGLLWVWDKNRNAIKRGS
jgi:hypothetical protein